MTDQTMDTPESVAAEGPGARERLADAFDRTAEKLHAKADDLTGARGRATDTAARLLDSASTFLDEFEPGDVVEEVVDLAKRHPGKALIAAALLGYFVGRALQSDE